MPHGAPTFYVTARQPLRPGVVLLAAAIVTAALVTLGYAAVHSGKRRIAAEGKDDPSQVDVIYVGDAADAPEPATARRARKPGDADTPVHPTILIRLPRYGEATGLIPDTPAGHLLYRWLAAFNQNSAPALDAILPAGSPGNTQVLSTEAQLALRKETGGFNLLSAKEPAPGVLVFRLRDQTPEAREALGALQLRPGSNPPAVATLSLRAVP